MDDSIKKAKKLDRINHVDDTIKRKGAGDFSMVPNCIYEMGLSRIDRDVWCYLHRIPTWEHPKVNAMPKILGIGKTQLMASLKKLEALNMIAVQGSGVDRIFHIPSPAYWNHPVPQRIYGFKQGDKKPVDIGKGIFDGELIRPKQDEKRPKQDEKKKRPKQDEISSQTGRKNVPNRTKHGPQTLEQQGRDLPSKTIQDSQDSFKSPGKGGQTSLPGVKDVRVTILDGMLKGLYDRFTSIDLLRPIIREMAESASLSDIEAFLKHRRKVQQGLMKWNIEDPDWWLRELDKWKEPKSEAEAEADVIMIREWSQDEEEAYRASVAAVSDFPY